MSTFALRQKLIDIARLDVNRVEVTKNRAPWIAKFWPATHYPDGMADRAPYCAAAGCYWVREWLKLPDVLAAFKMTAAQAEKWRCKSASVYKASDSWLEWAKGAKGVRVMPKNVILHTGDIVIYSYSHLEIVVDDDGGTTGPFIAIGANTDAGGSADGEGCFEKPRLRAKVRNFIRLLP
jgi:hypothetical protein